MNVQAVVRTTRSQVALLRREAPSCARAGRQPPDHPPIKGRRQRSYVAAVPRARKERQGSGASAQSTLDLGTERDVSGQDYALACIVDELRQDLGTWRPIPDENKTAREHKASRRFAERNPRSHGTNRLSAGGDV